jgi:hypothetical protein
MAAPVPYFLSLSLTCRTRKNGSSTICTAMRSLRQPPYFCSRLNRSPPSAYSCTITTRSPSCKQATTTAVQQEQQRVCITQPRARACLQDQPGSCWHVTQHATTRRYTQALQGYCSQTLQRAVPCAHQLLKQVPRAARHNQALNTRSARIPHTATAKSTCHAAHLEGCEELYDVLVLAAAVQAHLPVDLVLVQLTDAAHQVALEHHRLARALADGFVHCKG